MTLRQIEAIEAIVYGKFHDVNDVSRMDIDAVTDEILSVCTDTPPVREKLRRAVADIITYAKETTYEESPE